MEEEIDLLELFNIFWRKKFIIILVIFIFGVIGAVYNFNYKVPLYKSQARVLLTQNNVSNNTDDEITQTDIILNQQLISFHVTLQSKQLLVDNLLLLTFQNQLESNLLLHHIRQLAHRINPFLSLL